MTETNTTIAHRKALPYMAKTYAEVLEESGASPDNPSDPALDYEVVIDTDDDYGYKLSVAEVKFDHYAHEVIIVAS